MSTPQLWNDRFNRFVVLLQYNGTADGIYSVFTGKDDISKVGLIHSWRGKR